MGGSLIGLGLGAFGVGMQTMNSYRQQQSANEAADWNARIAEDSARNRDLQADDAIQRGLSEASLQQLRTRKQIGDDRARYGASGVDVNSGSPVDVAADTAAWGEYERQQVIANSEREAWGYRQEASNLRQQAALTRATKQSPWINAAATGISGTTSLWQSYSRY